MKKVKLLILTLLLLPITVLADDNVSGGTTVIPVGTITVFSGSTAPDGYMVANGASLSRTDYPELFKVIGTTYGNADATHFNLPNLSGRTVVGVNGADNDFKTVGQTGGAKSVTLTVNQMPSHTHTFTGQSSTTSDESNSHYHTFTGTTDQSSVVGSFSTLITSDGILASGIFSKGTFKATMASPGTGTSLGVVTYSFNSKHTHTFSGTTVSTTTHTHTVTPTGTNASTGGGAAHNNMQPYIAMNYIIKVK